MVDREVTGGSKITLALAVIFLFVVIAGVIDLLLDRPQTLLSVHVAVEILVVLLSLGAAAYLARGWSSAQSLLAASDRESDRLTREREEWKDRATDLLTNLATSISAQFDAWSLTPTESRVALMLIKGLSHKRIAHDTQTSERTVRQHAVAVYRKSGLGGRAALAGFFLGALPSLQDRGRLATPTPEGEEGSGGRPSSTDTSAVRNR